ncbi:FkbM family methyltransferase [Sphingomonas piscis]|uniref:FkbM family methyltransferase n=1 Tax=Sphingomonas piscis TaxID=2714943 RepID=A0A6G7YQV3_9SPHN|nr:FkbM family methyltransferase [Sphingomonas piscis]QIK79121.1 FkbM family methyltransferase [Sphingomonas piscis]
MTLALSRAYQKVVIATLRPYTLRQLPGWGRLYNRLAAWEQNDRWTGAPTVEMRHRDHGYVTLLDLTKWADRLTYFLGRWSDIAIQTAVKELVKPSDTIVDIGANRGDFSLFASSVVPQGKVISFEPNPVCRGRLIETIERNSIRNIAVQPFGLSDQPAELTLYIPAYNDGEATFAGEGAFDPNQTKAVTAEVRVGDNALCSERIALIKLDVEGFELHALKGLTETFNRDRPPLIIEIARKHLARAGSSPEQVISYIESLGYSGRMLGIQRSNGHHRFKLEALPKGDEGYDALFLHKDDPRASFLTA